MRTAEFLKAPPADEHGCLVLDIRLPGTNALDFQARLNDHGIRLPVVLMTAHGDLPMSVRGTKAGAVDSCESLSAIKTCSTPWRSPSRATVDAVRLRRRRPRNGGAARTPLARDGGTGRAEQCLAAWCAKEDILSRNPDLLGKRGPPFYRSFKRANCSIGYRRHRQMMQPTQTRDDNDIMVLNETWHPPLSRNVWRVNVLVVDDDPADAQLIARALRNNTDVREVFICNSPTKALLDLEAGRVQPTIILLDVRMPQIDGFQFLDSLRLIPAMTGVPVVFLTTSALWQDVKQANGCAISGYIVKPNSYDELKARLDAVVAKVLSLYK